MNFRFSLIFLLLFSFFSTYAQDSINKQVPTNILLKKSKQHSFSISPNGKYFVEVIENNIENDIVVIDIDNYKLHQRIPIGKKTIQNVYWLNNNRLIYESLGEILAIDIDGTNSTQIVNRLADKLKKDLYQFYKNYRFNSVISLLHNNENEILIETYSYKGFSSIKRVNIFTGQKVTIIDGNFHKINRWIVDYKGDVRLGVRYDDDSYIYLIKNEFTNEWEEFKVVLDGVEVPLKVNANSYLEQNINFEGFGYQTDIIYLTSNYGQDKRKLLSYSLKERKVVEVLLEDINCDINDPHGVGISLMYNSMSGDLSGLRYEAIIPAFKWYSSDFESYHTNLNSLYPQFVNDIIDSDITNSKLLIHQWNDINQGNIGVYNTKENTYSVMFHFNEELNKYKLSKTKIIIAEARDEYKIPCYLNLPIDYVEGDSIPLVVIPHGGPWARDYWGLDRFSQYFSTRGYATLRVNFRGSTGFGKKHVLSGVNSLDNLMIDDIADATKFIASKFAVNEKQIFIFGHSYGGYAAYMSLIKYPNVYAKGVAVSAPSDIKKWMKLQKKEKYYFSYEFWNSALGSNKSKYLEDISPISHAKDLKNPILIFHGKWDEIIPFEQSEDMASEIKKHNNNVKLEILQHEGHSIDDSNSLGYVLDSADDFFIEKKKVDIKP